MDKIKVGIIGMGYIGETHLETLQRLPDVEVAAIADANGDLALRKSREWGIKHCYDQVDGLLEEAKVQVVHNCTPNHMHLDISRRVIGAGKHIFSEKPLACTVEEAAELTSLLKAHPSVVGGVNFCYRMYPLIQELRARVLAGEIGRPRLISGSYLQDWLLYDTDYNWRVEKRYGGRSRCVADIGAHWIDLAQYIMGAKITEVCADTLTAHAVRKKPDQISGTFKAAADGEHVTNVQVDTEDYAGILLRFDNGARGLMHCSQVSPGRKCFIDLEIDGERAAFHWNHEHPNHMWKGKRDEQNQLFMRNPQMMPGQAARYSSLGAGHAEGWNDALKNNLTAFYRLIRQGRRPGDASWDFASFDEAEYIIRVTEAIMDSAAKRCWVAVT